MTKPWNGLPDQPERSGWHWLKHSNGNYPQPFEWNHDTRQWEVDIDDEGFPEEMVDSGYKYICRCPDPSELAQMRKDEREQAAQVCERWAQACGAIYDLNPTDYSAGEADTWEEAARAIRTLTDEGGKKS
ncbi:hypothetical protein [Komagataeibacter intermedius]|uniref:Phage protein n=1 Tax=Komagataeibacter intermedius NRIC 0521 TaxID=1307934 RepID=A0ABQ0PGS5_9PROT|nr:hypothetical protein [Komagataeibacter intermedius]GAN86395.1 hypothetical protein Gain_0027_070 [Komagataeibacter intermedius TF2]GBQ68094.1 hypothetical protein AA0521_1153 [Komagataeibacter intermedius NRIC 0521]